MSETALTPEQITELFSDADGQFRFARWGRPIAPVVFGVDDATLAPLKDAMATVAGIANMKLAETDPELGANLMVFFCADWAELGHVPNLGKLIPDLAALQATLTRAGANQYRTFRFDDAGAIRLCVLLLKMDETLAEAPVQALGCGQMTQSILLWGEGAFAKNSPIALVRDRGFCIVKPPFAALIRAAYDPGLPGSASDASHALRLAARAGLMLKDMNNAAPI